jgi:hypothetical protein
MWVFLFSAGCSEGFPVAAIDLNRRGGSVNRRYQMSFSEGFVLGFFLWFWLRFFQGLPAVALRGGGYSEVRGLSQSLQIKSIFIFYFFWEEGSHKEHEGHEGEILAENA